MAFTPVGQSNPNLNPIGAYNFIQTRHTETIRLNYSDLNESAVGMTNIECNPLVY